jgi:hypothetical protein
LDRARVELSSELVRRINRHRHGLSHEEFIRRCVDEWLQWQTAVASDVADSGAYVRRQEFEEFKSDSEMFLRAFLRFMLIFCFDLGNEPRMAVAGHTAAG